MNTLLREYFTACVSPRGKKQTTLRKYPWRFPGEKLLGFLGRLKPTCQFPRLAFRSAPNFLLDYPPLFLYAFFSASLNDLNSKSCYGE